MGKGTRIREIRRQGFNGAGSSKSVNPVLKRVVYWIIAVAVAAASIGIITLNSMVNSGFFLKRADAIKINDKTYKASELDFYYHVLWTNHYSYASQLASYGIDYGVNFNRSLFRQIYDSQTGQTWGDYLLNQAIENLFSNVVMASEAEKNGFTLSDIHKREIDKAISALETNAANAEATVGAYLKKYYGSATTLEYYRKYIEREIVSQYYASLLYDNIEISQDEIDIEYNKDKNKYDMVTYRLFKYTVDLDEHDEETDETKAQDEAKIAQRLSELNDALAAVKNEEEFNKLAEEWTKTTDSKGDPVDGVKPEDTLKERVSYSDLDDEESPDPGLEWLFSQTEAGKYYINRDKAALTVYYFIERDDNSFTSRSVRHILIRSDDKDDTINAQVESMLAEWNAGEKTEASFAALAEKYSEDTSSAVNGGLIKNIGPGMTVDEFDQWVMSDDRAEGDVEIVFTEDYGYHLMYYVGEGMVYRDVLVDSTLRSGKLDTLVEEIQKGYTLVRIESGISKIK